MGSGTSAFGPFVLDRERRMLSRNGQPVPIGHRGYVLLETLLDAKGEAVSKAALMERAWPGIMVEEGNLTVQMSTLRRQLGEGADSIIVTVPRVGYRLVAQPVPSKPDADGPPLIAVLPFANHGSAAEDGYFADGVVDDIITALSRFKSFAVVSRGSIFALRERGTDVRTAAAEFGVRYALEGSIRRMGTLLRVTAQLIEAKSGAPLWGERYDGTTADIFSFQDRITESVVGRIEPTIRKAEIERARRKPAANVDAYDLYLRALPMVYAPGPERHAEAIELLSKAAELDPGFALPRAYAALIYETRMSMRLPPLGNGDAETCIELARCALSLDGDDPLVRALCGWVLFRVANEVSAIEGLRAAARENPNNVLVLSIAADGVGMHGCFEESIQYHSRAYALSPGSNEAYQNLHGIGASYFSLGNYEAAIEWSLKCLATFNDLIYANVCLACSYAALDRMGEAQTVARHVLELNPALTIKLIEDGAAGKEDPFAVDIIPWLRKLGFPEE
jgi:TolB-like protein